MPLEINVFFEHKLFGVGLSLSFDCAFISPASFALTSKNVKLASFGSSVLKRHGTKIAAREFNQLSWCSRLKQIIV